MQLSVKNQVSIDVGFGVCHLAVFIIYDHYYYCLYCMQGSLGKLRQAWDLKYHQDDDDSRIYFQLSFSTHCKHTILFCSCPFCWAVSATVSPKWELPLCQPLQPSEWHSDLSGCHSPKAGVPFDPFFPLWPSSGHPHTLLALLPKYLLYLFLSTWS